MANPRMILTLAKVIIAAAWADGTLSNDEINSLKDLLFRLPDLDARAWASLEIYMDSPIDDAERSRLLQELKDALSSQKEKKLALAALDDLIHADGEVTPEEKAVAEEIRTAIEEAGTGILGGMAKLIQGPINRRSEAVANAPNREAYLEDFIRNRVYYGVQRRLRKGDTQIDLPDAELRKLSLAGGLMARVAHVNREVTEGELDAMASALRENWGLSEEAAALVAEVAISAIATNMDYYRLAREFFSKTDKKERVRFMDVLFSVAAGDGMVTTDETEQIRAIARNLKLTHRQFINAKLKIPREQRTG